MLAALLVVASSFIGGIFVGYNTRPEGARLLGILGQKPPAELSEVDFEPFWRAWRLVEEKHVGEEKIDRKKFVWGAIRGMVASLGDPYTVFFPPQEKADFNNEIKGEFSGIGAEIAIRKGILTVIAPLKGSPAEAAGLKTGDKILKINDLFTNDITLEEAIRNIRGERGTKVILVVQHKNEDKTQKIEVRRDTIQVPIVDTMQKPNGVFVIQLHSFSESSSSDFAKAVRKFLQSGSTKLVVDLRNNPGGFFSSAVDIASWWLPEGEMVAQEAYKDAKPDLFRSFGRKALESVPTVILVNSGSASASEILAGALQEHKKAILIGEKTFGKGSVQELEEVTPDTALKITIARWLTPRGKSISKEGLVPDIEVKSSDNNSDTKDGPDPQLERALEYFKTH